MTQQVTDQQRALRSAKRQALSLLLIATALFLLTSLSPHLISQTAYTHWSLYIQCLQTMAEAAMVGGLADWFAVSALFKRVPIPVLSRHTNIIPKNKDRIAKNLSVFIQEKFLEPTSLASIIQQKNPALMMGNWLSHPQNSQQVSKLFLSLMQKMLSFSDDKNIQRLMSRAIQAAIQQMNFSGAASTVLQTLIKEGRHHALLEQMLTQLTHLLSNEQTQTMIAEGIVDWLKDNHPVKEKILPSELIGQKGAKLAVATVSHLLKEIHDNPEHHLRHEFDAYTHRLIHQLANNPEYIARGESVKQYLLTNEAFTTYLGEIWQTFKTWLNQDIQRPDSTLQLQINKMGQWLGHTLCDDTALQETLNREIAQASKEVLPKLGMLLSKHIQDTVQQWDSQQLSEQIELNIGKDLQKIRVNGTILGAFIGFVLFVIAHIQSIHTWFFT